MTLNFLHLPIETIEKKLAGLPPAPRDEGIVRMVVARPDVGERIVPKECMLTPEGGVDGDRWVRRDPPIPDAQISVMRADVAEVLANGQPLELFGDNLLVELDLSPENLPLGAQVRIGTALCVVTPKPHTGCAKFEARFGKAARDSTSMEAFRDWRIRGLYVKVIEEGVVKPGDRVRVIAR